MKNIRVILSSFIALFFLQSAIAQTTIKINLSQVSGSPGDEVCVDVSFENFKDIQTAQWQLKFDPTKLEYAGVKQGALPLNLTTQVNATANSFRLVYDNVNGKTVTDGVTAFSICFIIKGVINDSDCLIFDETTFNTEFTKIDNSFLTPVYAPCNKISIVAPTLKPVRLTLGNNKAKVGDTTCIPIRVFDFNKIKTFELDITWDETKLKFEYLSGVDIRFAPNGTSTNFFTYTKNTGIMNIDWTADLANAANLSLPDSTVLFLMCFKVIGNEGDNTPIKVATIPAPKVITGTSNNQNVGLNTSNGSVKIPKLEPVKFKFCDNNQTKKINTGDIICLDIKVSDFDTIGGMSGTIAWDPDWFDYVEYKNVNPPTGVNNVTWTFIDSIKNTSNGYIPFAFESLEYTTLPANTLIFQVCLRAKGRVGLTQGLKIQDIPVTFEAWSKNSFGENIGYEQETNCPILIESAIKITDTLIVQPNCKNPIGGKISMTTAGGTPPYNYTWSPNAYNSPTEDVMNLPTGNFYCTVTDANLPKPNILILFFDLAGDLTKPTASAKITGNLECKANSFVTLDGDGSSTGNFYSYKWSSAKGVISGADDALTAKAISATIYELKVTDSRNGCSATSVVTVTPAPGAPNADAGPDVPLPCNLLNIPISLNAGCVPTGNTTYGWSSPNGGVITNKFTECSPLVRGAATYILTVTSTQNGCSAYAKTQVIGDANTPIAKIIEPDSLNCRNPTIILDGSQSSFGAGVSYEWAGDVTGTNPKLSTGKPGRYILIVRNNLGCAISDTVMVYDFRQDTVSASAISPIKLSCDGSPTKLNGNQSSKGADITYQWTIAPGNSGKIIDGANTLTPTISEVGQYLLTVINKKSYCEGIASVTVLQANTPQGVDAGIDSTLTCFTDEIELSGEAPSAIDFDIKWTTTNGAIKSGASTLKPVITKPGVYYFTVTEKATKCKTVDSLLINENKEKPNAKIIGLKELTCGQDTITLESKGSQGADLVEWFTKDGNIIDPPTSPEIRVNKEGTYILLATKASNGCADSAIHKIKFVYPAKGNAGQDSILCSSDKITLTATISGNVTGLWTSLDGATIEDKNSNITEVDSLKTGRNRFAWVLTASGCPNFSKDTVEIFVEKPPVLKDDSFGERNSGTFFNVPVASNDDLKGVKSWKIELLSQPTYGILEATPSKSALRYKPGACFAGLQEFSYKICSQFCPTKCDTANVKLNILEDPDACDSIVIANVITPNADGKNDVFKIDAIDFQPERFKNAELIIFNRWGDVVYRSGRPYANNWAGTNQNGGDLPEATYYYILDLNLPDGKSYRGDITILR